MEMGSVSTVKGLLEVAEKLQGSVKTHIKKLLMSHGYEKDKENPLQFFVQFMDSAEDFFEKENMPEEWSLRSYSSAMESVGVLLKEDSVKAGLMEVLPAGKYESLLEEVDTQRKKYGAMAKAASRHAALEQTLAVKKEEVESSLEEVKPAVVESAAVAPVVEEKKAETLLVEAVTPVVEAVTPVVEAVTPVVEAAALVVETAPAKEVAKEADRVIKGTVVDVQKNIKHLGWILERYTEIESDEFKKLILGLMKQELEKVSEGI
jgi:hypothetical protein